MLPLTSNGPAEPPSSSKRKRARQACDHCRAKKIRCEHIHAHLTSNGELATGPCPNCIDRGLVCVTSSRGRQRDDIVSDSREQDALVTHDTNGNSPAVSPDRSSVLSSDLTNWEYHGARSYLSICSKPAVKWVNEQVPNSDFANTATHFASDITRRLKMTADLSSARAPEPDSETAWRYTAAYFDNALDAALGIVHRPWFEQQLRAHLSGNLVESSATWHALRNVVYAAGCHVELSKSCSLQEASQRAWTYFENALAVYARLLFYTTSITGVQVLTLMAYYTQNLATPCLEYMLSADAVRLAFTKGLHRAAPSSQVMTGDDMEQRSRIFWAIYCLEKQIASQANRPSIIDDDDVTCPLPSAGTDASTFSLAYCHSLIKISKVSSQIEKQLSAVRCYRMGATKSVQTVRRLQNDLDSTKASLYDAFGLVLGKRVDLSDLPKIMTADQLIYRQFAYCTAVLSVHTVMAYPWIRPLLGLRVDDEFRGDITRSSDIVAQTSREMIMMTEHIHFKAHTPVPITFFGPVYALISLFVCCLDRRKIVSDLEILDVAVGYFARLHLATGSLMSHTFARALTSLAYDYDKVVAQNTTRSLQHVIAGANVLPELDVNFWQPGILEDEGVFRFEDWATFSRMSPADYA